MSSEYYIDLETQIDTSLRRLFKDDDQAGQDDMSEELSDESGDDGEGEED